MLTRQTTTDDTVPWTDRRQAHWQQNLRLTAILLVVWFAVSFVLTFYARELNFSFFGGPFSFWLAALGAPLVYVIIVACYAHHMERLDRQHDLAEDDHDPA